MNILYAGSFDPFTNGHLHVIKQAHQIFDEVVVAISENPSKTRIFPAIMMQEAIRAVIDREKLNKVKVLVNNGLTVNFAKEVKADFLMRGLRNGVDYDFEENLALINQNIAKIETIYFRAGKTAHVSSSAVVELWSYGVDISDWVSLEIKTLMEKCENKCKGCF